MSAHRIRRCRGTAVLTLAAVLAAATVHAQEAPARPAPPADVPAAQARLWERSVARWDALLGKVVTMARRFPQEKAGFRFHTDARTFLEEVWHETFDQQMLQARLRGTQKTIDLRKLYRGDGRPTALASAADELDAVRKDCAALLRGTPDLEVIASLDFYIEHASVTYGKLAAMFRANGLVPPLTAEIQAKAGSGRVDHP